MFVPMEGLQRTIKRRELNVMIKYHLNYIKNHPKYKEILSKGKAEGDYIIIEPQSIRGLGDLVSIIAQPVAKGIDRVFKTHIQGCTGCQKRREALNKAVPFSQSG